MKSTSKIYLHNLIFTLLSCLLLFISLPGNSFASVNTKTSTKKGAAYTFFHYNANHAPDDILYCEHTNNPTDCYNRLKIGIADLGITWMYNWTPWEGNWTLAQRLGLEFVPMIMTGENTDKSYSQAELNHYANIAHSHPGSYWLIFNEPDFTQQNNLTSEAAARIYKPLSDALLSADPSAKMIVGGMLYDPHWWMWAKYFRESFKEQFGQFPPLAGWHVHYYHCSDYSSTNFQTALNNFRTWIDGNGGGELWLTEFGCLNYDYPQILSQNMNWMETYDGINRYAWFHIGNYTSMWSPTFNATPDNPNFALTNTGIVYAENPSNGQALLTPTPTQILNRKIGDANNDGRVDGSDYVIWLNHFNLPNLNGQNDGDFNSDGRVDGLDYVIWLNNFNR